MMRPPMERYVAARTVRPQPRGRLAGPAVAGLILLHRLVIFLVYRQDLARHLALEPGTLTWQYPTAAALDHHLTAALLYLQQTPPIPVAILGAAWRLFGGLAGSTLFCLAFEALIAAACAWLMVRLLCTCGATAVGATIWMTLLFASIDLVIIEYNSFGQTFYEPLAMLLVVALLSSH
ncbi:MAG: hypothetical protein ACE5IK_14565, partial [Acidobacteriota bacterium]